MPTIIQHILSLRKHTINLFPQSPQHPRITEEIVDDIGRGGCGCVGACDDSGHAVCGDGVVDSRVGGEFAVTFDLYIKMCM